MGYLDQLLQLQNIVNNQRDSYINQIGITPQRPYASFYPEWETTTPQYQYPNAWSLAQLGFRSNELVYTCIQARASAISEAHIKLVRQNVDKVQEVDNHPMLDLLKAPTPGLSEQEFWQVAETYCLIAGFSAWEKERDKSGKVIRLWPMRPDWCSYIRGQQKPIAAIRYQPWGLQFADIPIEDVVLFQYFDPMYPLLKGFSPLMVALDLVDTDNTATKVIKKFLENGNFLGGVLKTEQVLQEQEAERIRERWKTTHSGSDNSGSIAVFGKGVDFTPTSQSFRDATFPELDARSEARICMVFRVPPMLIGAKIGMDRSTYSNYTEARKGFYEGIISSEWKFLAGQITEQLLPDYGDKTLSCEFETSEVKALQEDRNAQITRARDMWANGFATLNEARKEALLDAIEGEEGDKRKEEPQQQPAAAQNGMPAEKPAAQPVEKPVLQKTRSQSEEDAAKAEVKSFRRFAKSRISEHKEDEIRTFSFKYLDMEEQASLLGEFEMKGRSEIAELALALNILAEKLA